MRAATWPRSLASTRSLTRGWPSVGSERDDVPLLTAAQWHVRNHDPDVAFYGCARCLAQYGICQRKARYSSPADALAAADSINAAGRADALTAPYRCRVVCFRWHLTTARKGRLKRATKRYRRSLWRVA